MNNKQISIAVITFVIIYLLFAIFISLFRGITLHNIKVDNIYIKRIFFKLHNRFVLKLNSITITPKNTKTDLSNLNKKLYLISKIIPSFESIEVKNIRYKNTKIDFTYKDKNLSLKINDYLIFGKVNFKDTKIIFDLSLKYKNFLIPFKGEILYDKLVKANLIINYQNYKANAIVKVDKDITYKVNSPLLAFKNFLFQNLIIDGKLNLNTTNITQIIKAKYLKGFYKIPFEAKKLLITQKNKKITFKVKEIHIPKFKNIKKIILFNLKGEFNKFLVAKGFDISFNLENINIFIQNANLKYRNSIQFNAKKLIAVKNNLLLISNNIKLQKDKKLSFITHNTTILSPYFKLFTDMIKGRDRIIFIQKINGSIKNFPSTFKDIKIDYYHKNAFIKKIAINNVPLFNTEINITDFIKITSFSNAKIDKNFNAILKTFYPIKIIQLKGKNKIRVVLKIKKNIDYFIQVTSKDSVGKYRDIFFRYDFFSLLANNYQFNGWIENLNAFYKKIHLISNINFNGTKNFLYIKSFIKNLNIYDFIKVKNKKEEIIFSFPKNQIIFKNTNLFIDTFSKTLFIPSLSKILPYTPLKNLVKNGILVIKFNPFIINGDVKLKYPIVKEVKNFHIKIKDKIYFSHKNINAIVDDNLIDINLSNIDINLTALLKVKDKLSSKSRASTRIIKIYSKNTNLIYNSHKFLSQQMKIDINDKNISFFSKYKDSYIKGNKKLGYILVYGKNYSKEELVPLLAFFKKFKKIKTDFSMIIYNNFILGKIFIRKAIVKELTLLNNIMAFLNTIPSLLSFSSPGFSAKGYKVQKGTISYVFFNNNLYFKRIYIKGENIDFVGRGYINLKKKLINLKMTAKLKLKLKKIPILKGASYILLGKDGSLNVKIIIKGNLDNPKVIKDIGSDVVNIINPFKLLERTITLPFNLF